MRRLTLVVSSFALVLAATLSSPMQAAALIGGPHEGMQARPNVNNHPMAFDRARAARGAAATLIPSVKTVSGTYAYVCDGAYDVVPSPNGTGHNDIFNLSALSPSDIWAVGVQTNSSGYDRTLAEHWNGSTWSIVPTPNPGSSHNDLNAVSAVSTNNVWAVGDYFDNNIGA